MDFIEKSSKYVKVVLFDRYDITGYNAITGFPGFGYTGYLTTRYIVQELRMKRMGVIVTQELPDYTSLEDYGIVFPHEIFVDQDNGLIVVINHSLPVKKYRDHYVKVLLKWLKDNNIGELVLIGGLNAKLREGAERYRWIKGSTSKRILNAPQMKKGLYVVGPLAHTILYSELLNIPYIVVLPYAEPLRPDPRAAAIAVEVINELYGLSIDTSKLYEEARRIEQELAEILRQQEEAMKKSRKGEYIYM